MRAIRLDAKRIAALGLTAQFLALIRTLGEVYRIRHFSPAGYSLANIEPFVGAALFTACVLGLSVAAFSVGRHRTAATIAAANIAALLVYKVAFMEGWQSRMTTNKTTIEAYMDGFRKTDRDQILSCLTDDVEWVIPGEFHVRGKDDFAKHIVDEGFAGQPEITVHRLIESGEVVVAEGFVRAPKKDGTVLDLVFCDVFDMRGGKIRRLTSYLMEAK